MDVRLVATRFVEAYNATLAVARDVLPERLAVDDDDARARALVTQAVVRARSRGYRIVARGVPASGCGA